MGRCSVLNQNKTKIALLLGLDSFIHSMFVVCTMPFTSLLLAFRADRPTNEMKRILHLMIRSIPGAPVRVEYDPSTPQNIRFPALFIQPLLVQRPAITFGKFVTLTHELACTGTRCSLSGELAPFQLIGVLICTT